MPIGTEDPRFYPANTGPHTSTGAKYAGMEARAGKHLNQYLIEREGTFTLVAAAPAVGDVVFEADAAHGITIGDVVEIYEDDVYYQGLVLGVVGDTITVDSPLPYAFTVDGAAGIRGVHNANLDGSATAKVFEIAPPTGQIWDITKISIFLEGTTAAPTHSLFCDIAAITNGVVLRVKRSAAKYENMLNAKANIDFMVDGFETYVNDDMTAAAFGVNAFKTFGNEGEAGAMIRLNGTLGEKLEFIVQDSLVGLADVNVKAQGYFLDEQ
jgi:hypothetical protein